MKYDVFISYSRKDYEFAEKVCSVFEAYKEHYSFDYFFDREAIKGRQDYLKRISEAIIESKIILFLSSNNSAQSEFCSKELNFADKHKKPIYQYRIEDFELPYDIDMLLCNQHYRQFSDFTIEEMVREVLSEVLECKIKEITTTGITQPKSILDNVLTTVTAIPAPVLPVLATAAATAIVAKSFFNTRSKESTVETEKIYQVGDYYDDGIRKGVVFKVTHNGRHGRIVSLKQRSGLYEWASSSNFGSFFMPHKPSKIKIGCVNESDGAKNLLLIQKDTLWYSKFPAFEACVSEGEGWYLPAAKELKTLLSDEVRDIVNNTFSQLKSPKLYSTKSSKRYWSSTECDDSLQAKCVSPAGYTVKHLKCYCYSVRAISAF